MEMRNRIKTPNVIKYKKERSEKKKLLYQIAGNKLFFFLFINVLKLNNFHKINFFKYK